MLLSLFSLRFQRIATSLRITTNMDNQESTSPTLNGGGHLPEGLFPHVLLRLRELKDENASLREDKSAKSALFEKQRESLIVLQTRLTALQTRHGALLTERNALRTLLRSLINYATFGMVIVAIGYVNFVMVIVAIGFLYLK